MISKYWKIALTITTCVGTAAAESLPVRRSLTNKQGRTMAVTILKARGLEIRIKRMSDSKELSINASTLSPGDQTFVASLDQTTIGEWEQAKNPPLFQPEMSTISISEKVVPEAGDRNGMVSSATPVFVRGKDMTSSPAYLRIMWAQLNYQGSSEEEPMSTFAIAPKAPDITITSARIDYPYSKDDSIKFHWYADVWQDGKLVCKSYKANEQIDKLGPPAQVDLDKAVGPINLATPHGKDGNRVDTTTLTPKPKDVIRVTTADGPVALIRVTSIENGRGRYEWRCYNPNTKWHECGTGEGGKRCMIADIELDWHFGKSESTLKYPATAKVEIVAPDAFEKPF